MQTTSSDGRDGEGKVETPPEDYATHPGRAQTGSRKSFLKAIALFVAPPILLSALVASSVYSHSQVIDALNSLEGRIDELLERRAETGVASADTGVSSFAQTTRDEAAVNVAGASANVHRLENIEERLSGLTEGVNLLISQMTTVSESAVRRPSTPPPLPILPNHNLSEMQAAELLDRPFDKPDGEFGIAEASRVEANEILREYAEQARAVIEEQHAMGTLDRAAMERIKRETLNQASGELQSRLPPEVFEEMFPQPVERPEL